jgi:hypothetical protein
MTFVTGSKIKDTDGTEWVITSVQPQGVDGRGQRTLLEVVIPNLIPPTPVIAEDVVEKA